MRRVRRVAIAFFWIVPISLAQTDWQALGNVLSFEKRLDGIDLVAQHGRVRVSVLSPAVIRVLYSHQDQFLDRQSFAVLPNRIHGENSNWQVEEASNEISLNTGEVTLRISKSPMHISFVRPDHTVISEDLPASPPAFNGSEFKVWKTMPEDEHYFGLGD